MTISVVIPTYNRADLLPATVESLLAQTRRPDEIVVVDDGSTDATASVAARYAPAVRYIRQANAGPSAARNTGLASITGEAVLFIDSDDLLQPSALERLEAALETRQQDALPCLAFCRAALIDQSGAVINPLWQVEDDPSQDMWARLLAGNCLRSPGAVLIRRDALVAAGVWDEALRGNEDWELWLRLSESGKPFARVVEPLFWYRVHGTNASDNRELMLGTLRTAYEKHLQRHAGSDPERYAVVWTWYQAILDSDDAAVAAAIKRALTETVDAHGRVPAPVQAAVTRVRRHRFLRGLIVKSGAATVYRGMPQGLRQGMRTLFGIDPNAV